MDTADMKGFDTGHPFTPRIFVDSEQECFVAQNRSGWPEPKMRYVPRHEARRLAELYHVEDLKLALAEKPPKYMTFHDRSTGRIYDTRTMRRVELTDRDDEMIYVADDRRCFNVDKDNEQLKELRRDEAEKLAEIFGRSLFEC